jgi:hypothetical protein
MEWTQVLTLVGSNIGLMVVSIGSTITLFLWARSEAREDQRELREIIAADRRDFLDLIREIKEELKDFHARLYALEKSYFESKKTKEK